MKRKAVPLKSNKFAVPCRRYSRRRSGRRAGSVHCQQQRVQAPTVVLLVRTMRRVDRRSSTCRRTRASIVYATAALRDVEATLCALYPLPSV